MANAVRCDGCQKVGLLDGLVGWLTVEDAGINVRTYEQRQPPFHFCGYRCLAQWAQSNDRVSP